jgi:putative ABC transport system substrate-binding protein
MQEAGFIEGQNVAIEYRWSQGQSDQLPKLAAELLRDQVAVIVASGADAAIAGKAATTTIPIIFVTGDDPIRLGIVASFNRPGGNITGISFFNGPELESKQLELLHKLVPAATAIGLLVNPKGPTAEAQAREARVAARALGLRLLVLNAGSERDFDTAFATLAQQRAGALLITGTVLFTSQRDRLVALAARHHLPTMYPHDEFVAAGGLTSYSPSISDAYRQAGIYTSRILKGAKRSDLPVMLPTKFELAINLKAANALGLTIPPGVLAITDEVIE